MPSIEREETPRTLLPYLHHGVDLSWKAGDTQARAECPFCQKRKFYVGLLNGLWDCKTCPAGGNAQAFLSVLWESSKASDTELEQFAESRGFIDAQALKEWGCRKSLLTGDWIIPGYNAACEVVQLYRYVRDQEGKRMYLQPTTGLGHGMFGVANGNALADIIYVCEGLWDGIALHEVLDYAKENDEGGLICQDRGSGTMLDNIRVVGVPSANVFHDSWCNLFAGKKVIFFPHNDHPKKSPRTKVETPPAGYTGMKRAVGILLGSKIPPSEIGFVSWGPEGFDSRLKSGYDIRDVMTECGELIGAKVTALDQLLDKVESVPDDWLADAKEKGKSLYPLPCLDWKTLRDAWTEGYEWTPGLDITLSAMLASVTSVRLPGAQLWLKVMGPPACGKTDLCEALSVATKHVRAKSILKGFYSGYQQDKEGSEDNSILAQLADMTLVTKDGDTLLEAPNRSQILSQARDVYDTNTRSHFNNKMSRDYLNLRMTWLLCGTESLRQLDSSELGERFLDVRVMSRIDDALEDAIGRKAIAAILNNKGCEVNGRVDMSRSPELTKAMQLTGGYVEYLRQNAAQLLAAVTMDEKATERCMVLGKFIAFMRARPSKKQEEETSREISTRLRIQLTRLALCLAVVLNRKSVDTEVMRRVDSIARDTAQGRTLRLTRYLYEAGNKGHETVTLAAYTGEKEVNELILLKFLRKIEAVVHFRRKIGNVPQRPRWRLTDKMRYLYAEVMVARGAGGPKIPPTERNGDGQHEPETE